MKEKANDDSLLLVKELTIFAEQRRGNSNVIDCKIEKETHLVSLAQLLA